MPDSEQKDQSDFLSEKIKVKPVNKKKLLRKTIITAAMAVIFGLIACFTFLILEPVFNNWLYPEEEPPLVVFPEDQEEMSPEDMLAENIPTESPSPEPEQEGVVLEDEQIQEILAEVTLDLENYVELYSALSAYVNRMNQYMVTVTAVTSNVDWFQNVQESRSLSSGVIFYNTGMELLILTDYSFLMSAEQLLLTFYNGVIVEAQLKQMDQETGLAVLSVDLMDMPDEFIEDEFPAVPFGSSNGMNLVGTPVIALGSPMGVSNSMGYGMITSSSGTLCMTDRNYRQLQTDICGSRDASGMIFNLKGQMLGVIMKSPTDSDMANVIAAYSISDLQKMVQKMSNASPVAYMGITGGDVPREAHQQFGVPYGAYVEKVAMDSPAMRAGIQRGDVITGMNDTAISSYRLYSNALLGMVPNDTVEVVVMRQVQQGEYSEMSFHIELGEGN